MHRVWLVLRLAQADRRSFPQLNMLNLAGSTAEQAFTAGDACCRGESENLIQEGLFGSSLGIVSRYGCGT
jgi:hypothetical protein